MRKINHNILIIISVIWTGFLFWKTSKMCHHIHNNELQLCQTHIIQPYHYLHAREGKKTKTPFMRRNWIFLMKKIILQISIQHKYEKHVLITFLAIKWKKNILNDEAFHKSVSVLGYSNYRYVTKYILLSVCFISWIGLNFV